MPRQAILCGMQKVANRLRAAVGLFSVSVADDICVWQYNQLNITDISKDPELDRMIV